MSENQFRQGDVLIIKESNKTAVPNLKEMALGKLGPVLALGEVTGHHHTVLAHPEIYEPKKDLPGEMNDQLGKSLVDHAQTILDEMILKSNVVAKQKAAEPACRLYENGNDTDRTLVVFRPTLLRHEEHPAIFLDKGTYRVVKQREFTPQGWVDVQD